MTWITAYIFTAIAFFAFDLLWLGLIARNFYFSRMDHLLAGTFNYPAAAAFYAVYIIGLIIFAVAPAIEQDAWQRATIYGALFGFFCYATYDMTNLATLKNWPVAVSVVDILWGSLLSASAATIGYFATRTVS